MLTRRVLHLASLSPAQKLACLEVRQPMLRRISGRRALPVSTKRWIETIAAVIKIFAAWFP
jgi:hypothetical protein